MSEKLNNNAEKAPSGSGSETEYPPFDPEAAKRRIAEYKAAHPQAVDDVDKAYEMAKAEDPYRTEAADYRKGAKLAWDKVHKNRRAQVDPTVRRPGRDEAFYQAYADSNKKTALEYEKKARINDSEAERIGQATGERYDYNKLSPEAQEELKQRRMAEYKASHPQAVEDVDKARKMAEAEDPYRTEAVKNREFAKNAWERRDKALAMDYEADAAENDDIAEARGQYAGELYDSGKANPEAEEEAKQRRIAEYKAAHPDAIDDIEKARFMAEAGNELESAATTSKEKAIEAFKAGDYDSAKDTLEQAKEKREAAHRAEEEAGEFYDQMKNI